MQSVSFSSNGAIQSKYFEVNYRPSLNNSALNIACSSLITYMAIADLAPNDRSIANLKEKFLVALSKCQSEEEIKNFEKFLIELTKIGGYAQLFYPEVSNMLNMNGKVDSVNKLEEIEKNKGKAVSNRIEKGIESKYFDIKYRPNDGMTDLDINCSSLITYMAIADIIRDEERIEKLKYKFYQCLSMCETEEDVKNFSSFMRKLANVGGYAYIFNNEYSKEISFFNLESASKIFDEMNRKKENQKKESRDLKQKLQDFKSSYTDACELLEKIKSAPLKDDGDIAFVLRMFNSLQADLFSFNDLDKEFVTKTDAQLEENINYLRDLYNAIDKVNNRIM